MNKKNIKLVSPSSLTNVSSPQALKSNYIIGIDGLRALAVFLVVIYHFFPNIMPSGYLGVDIFFVISGFLIGRIIINGIGKPNFLINFYLSRIKRIFPPLIVLFLLASVFGFILFDKSDNLYLQESLWQSALFIVNLTNNNLTDYFAIDVIDRPLLHLWSLSIEEQFYIFIPALLILLRKNKISLTTSLILLFCISLFSNAYSQFILGQDTFFNSIFRFWELIVGVLLAANIKKIQKLINSLSNATVNYLMFLATVTLIIATLILINDHLIKNIFAVIFASAMICNAVVEKSRFFILRHKFFVFFGNISFALYLYHWLFLTFTYQALVHEPSTNIKLLILIMSILFSCFSTYFIENPIRNLKNKYLVSSLLTSLILIFAFIGFFNWGNTQVYTYKDKIQAEFLDSYPKWDNAWLWQKSCQDLFGPQFSQFCISNNINAKPDILIIGDSIANHLFPGMNKVFAGKNITQIGRAACAPALDLDTLIQYDNIIQKPYWVGCNIMTQEMIDYIVATEPEIIIISFAATKFLNGAKNLNSGERSYKGLYFNLNSSTREPINDKFNLLNSAFLQTLKYFPKESKIIFVDPPPRLNYNPVECIDKNVRWSDKTFSSPSCSMNKKIYEKDFKDYETLIDNLTKSFKNVQRVKIDHLTCNDSKCFSIVNRKSYYRDANHFSEYGSIKIAEHLNTILTKK